MDKIGLNGALERIKDYPLRLRLKQLWWELRYAWQRAWRGYDRTDVFNLGYNFASDMPTLLERFLKNNNALFYDSDAKSQLTKGETDAVIREMIYYFENCDEDHVFQRMSADSSMDYADKVQAVYIELRRCRAEALRLFSKWCFHLWY